MNVRPEQKTVESRPLVRKASIRAVCLRLLAERPAPADWPERLREAESAASNSVPPKQQLLISISFGFTASYGFSAWRSRIGEGAA